MRYFLKLAYQGTQYSGWQRQTSTSNTVQQVIEEAISKMLCDTIYIKGCGRTDAGVHASEYYAHLDIQKLPEYDFIDRINYILPDDISILAIMEVDSGADAQFDANWRTYEYYFHLRKTPKLNETSTYYNIPQLNIERITKALPIIAQTEDFRSLCKHPEFYKHTRCTIREIKLEKTGSNEQYKLTITANRFLRGMIRYMVGRLIDIGEDKLSIEDFKYQLVSKKSFEFPFHKQAHPQGLYLSKIEYPDNMFADISF